MPRPIVYVLLVVSALTLLPLAFLARARFTPSTRTRIQVVPDMDSQPKFKAQVANPLFADGRAARLPVAGTVARGRLAADDLFFRGLTPDSTHCARLPVEITPELMARGRERFDIFCAVCHGASGNGRGLVHQHAEALAEGTWIAPSDLTSPLVAERPAGYLFAAITHGIRNMPGYGRQVRPADRWAIVAYLRALQRSARGTLEDLPADARRELE